MQRFPAISPHSEYNFCALDDRLNLSLRHLQTTSGIAGPK
jgi:hypothetical protein